MVSAVVVVVEDEVTKRTLALIYRDGEGLVCCLKPVVLVEDRIQLRMTLVIELDIRSQVKKSG